MDERKRTRGKDDDMPIIGDYSDTRVPPRAPPQTPPPSPPPPRPASGTGNGPTAEQWRVDPGDVRRHAELRRRRDRVGPVGKLGRYGAAAIALAAVGAGIWNFDTLRNVTVDFSAVTDLFRKGSVNRAGVFGGPTEETVEAAAVVGAAAPTSLSDEPPLEDATVTESPSAAPLAGDSERMQTAAAPVAVTPPPPPPAPEPPPGPVGFEFGLGVVSISESEPSVAVLVIRTGDRRRAANAVWWTEDGTATAGTDYANLGRVDVRFAPSEQNRSIHIPIVGDRNVEGPETFYVYVANADVDGEPPDRLEVIINDDD